jgi:hypothetical protein
MDFGLRPVCRGTRIYSSSREGQVMPSFRLAFVIRVRSLGLVVLLAWAGPFRTANAQESGRDTTAGSCAPTIDASCRSINSLDADSVANVSLASGPLVTAAAGSNPDIIVGHVSNTNTYGASAGIGGYAVGSISCNVGTDPAMWVDNTNEHPVISQTLFRLNNDRFEQIGISWVKHGFAALTGSLCCPAGQTCCQNPGTFALLGVGCSDPYDASLNGNQSFLGPRFEINAFTGAFPYPGSRPPLSNPPLPHERRLRVQQSDIDPAQNAGAEYFAEIQYVAADDSLAGNQDNNVSYRKAVVPGNVISGAFVVSLPSTESTIRQDPAINVWKLRDPSVELVDIRVPSEGLMRLGAKATDLGNGTWQYEYALYNMNSHRSASSFTVPIDSNAIVTNVGFHDVDYHSGEPFEGTDWTATIGSSSISWSTTPYTTNQNANALRWGTLYNFRFQANVGPVPSSVEIGLFRPGLPASVSTNVVGPVFLFIDCNENSVNDPDEVAAGTSRDCNQNSVLDECDIADGTGDDLDGDGILDECCSASMQPTAESLSVPGSGVFVNQKSRYLSVRAGDPGAVQAIRVTFAESPAPWDINNGKSLYVGSPRRLCENSGQSTVPEPGNPPDFGCAGAGGAPRTWVQASLQCQPHYMDWHGRCNGSTCSGGLRSGFACTIDSDCLEVVHISHAAIVPGRAGDVMNPRFEVQVIGGRRCPLDAEHLYSPALEVTTSLFGDIVMNLQTNPPAPPNGLVDLADIVAGLDKFRNVPGAVAKVRADNDPLTPDFLVTNFDFLNSLDAFQGAGFSFVPVEITCP